MEHRVAMISGASGGIGACIAKTLTAQGWGLSLGARDPAPLQRRFPKALVVPQDATRSDEAAWVADTRTRFGRIDALICSAGQMIPEDIVDISDETLDLMWDINVKSPRRLVHAAWPDLVEAKTGRVVLLVSLSGKRVRSAASSSYAVTKHAALAMNHGIRQKGWKDGIRSTAICPGRVNTSMARAIADTPPGQMTQPENIAKLAKLAIDMPNEASMAEIMVNCDLEDQY
ncbi:SDR family NAD(P)-dependent oxidoreductase [Roseovarius sp. MMSF_3281]|uniref:SDR family NAD(P)-dependent oxidoreductase n=1 Tax=Roseovarius sp. MMSF_3281 TaxID=3046694 RepID=UPI00273FD7D4|nr:SDR family NAD(P)-dependent oxidoreductase [Roseovarius sp. MMSF_3281]